ncbi:hypothetical protein ACQEUU_37265 [Nonomuraea sp. CA-218870]|uniref:hypothetical protein n=1 Tax=Nonomuraea sp. CA-218870 TaxID=3239998 RepID=UPI003D8E5607
MTQIAKREPEPLTGRIMAAGDHYRGRFAAYEAPADAIPIRCPILEEDNYCQWAQAWDTPDECRDAQVTHARDGHNHPNPEAVAHDQWGRW